MVPVLLSSQFFIKLSAKNRLEQILEFSFISRFMIKYTAEEEIHFQKIKQLCTSDATHVPVPLIRSVHSAESILAKFMVLFKKIYNFFEILIVEFKDTCKWRAKIRLLKDPDAMIANPELMRIENFSVISNPKGHHHSYHCQQMNLDPDTLHKK